MPLDMTEVKAVNFDELFALGADVAVWGALGRQLILELEADGAFADFAEAFAEVAERGIQYAVGTSNVDEGVREYTDWRG